MGIGDFFVNNCYSGNFCKYWEPTEISEICKHPKCKGMGTGERNEINREIAKQCVKENLFTEREIVRDRK